MKYRQNLHTHTVYCDGKNTLEELIRQAIDLGFDSLGFSMHSYMPYSAYANITPASISAYEMAVRKAQETYADQIDIYCGLELDMYSNADLSAYDYILGAMHYLKIQDEYVGFDRSAEQVQHVIDTYFHGDGMLYAKEYYKQLATMPKYGKIDIVAHFDLITKHADNVTFFDEASKTYQSAALEALHALAEKIDVFEVNTGAIARGYRKIPYPAPFILKELKTLGKKIIISSDCHDKTKLDCHFDEALHYVKSNGFNEIYRLQKNGFVGSKL